jgi:hypothetical protein
MYFLTYMFFSNIWTFLRIIRLHFNYSCFKTLNYLRFGPHFKQSYTDGIGRRDEYETLRKNSRRPMFFPVRAHVFPSMVPGKSSNLFWTHNIVPMKVSNLLLFKLCPTRPISYVTIEVSMSTFLCRCLRARVSTTRYTDVYVRTSICYHLCSLAGMCEV